MTKANLQALLSQGKALQDILSFRAGQGGDIFKKHGTFAPGGEIIYIPDLSLYDIPIDLPLDSADQEHVLSLSYSGDEFISICCGNRKMADNLFGWCDWQSPEAALPEVVSAYSSEEPEIAFWG